MSFPIISLYAAIARSDAAINSLWRCSFAFSLCLASSRKAVDHLPNFLWTLVCFTFLLPSNSSLLDWSSVSLCLEKFLIVFSNWKPGPQVGHKVYLLTLPLKNLQVIELLPDCLLWSFTLTYFLHSSLNLFSHCVPVYTHWLFSFWRTTAIFFHTSEDLCFPLLKSFSCSFHA